jgi:hypothetical protein
MRNPPADSAPRLTLLRLVGTITAYRSALATAPWVVAARPDRHTAEERVQDFFMKKVLDKGRPILTRYRPERGASALREAETLSGAAPETQK